VSHGWFEKGRLVFAAALVVGVLAPASAGAFGLQRTITPVGGAANRDQDIAINAANQLWVSVQDTHALLRYDPTGTFLQAIGVGHEVHGVAVNRISQDVYVTVGDGPGNGPADVVQQYTAAGSFVRAFAYSGGGGVRLRRLAVNGLTGDVYVLHDQGITRFDQFGVEVRTIATQGRDVEVEPASGDVLIAELSGTVTRLRADLSDPQTAYQETLGAGAYVSGIAAGPSGEIWVSVFNDCVIRKISSSGQVLRTAGPNCGTAGRQPMGIEADGLGGAWVPSEFSMAMAFYFATDPPVASFTSNPDGAIQTGTHVDFTSTSTDADGTIAATAWDLDDDGQFDDGTGVTAGRTFATAGDFTVRMRVTDDELGIRTQSRVIHVINQAPAANFTVSPASPIVGQTITLSSTSTDPDGTIVNRDWDLDDDGQFDDAAGSVTTKSFATAGDHHVRLRVEDNDGNVTSRDRIVTVSVTPVSAAVGDVSIVEGADGTTTYLQFPLTLGGPSTGTVSLDYEVLAGTARDGADFASRSASALTFSPGVTSRTVRVPVYGDDVDEANETVLLTLSQPQGTTIADGSATGTIIDDDASPAITAHGPGTVTEGQDFATITVELAARSEQPITVTGTPAADTASAGSDFTAAPVLVTIPAGATSRSFAIPVADDGTYESTERFRVTLASAFGPVTPASLTIVVADDDGPPPALVGPGSLGSVTEGTGSTGPTVNSVWRLDHPNAVPLTFTIADKRSSPRFSVPGYLADIADLPRQVVIPAGATQVTVPLTVIADDLEDRDEPVVVTGSLGTLNDYGEAIAVEATLTILNDDAPRYSIDDFPRFGLLAPGRGHDVYTEEGENVRIPFLVFSERDESTRSYRFRFAPGTNWRTDFIARSVPSNCRNPEEHAQGWSVSDWCATTSNVSDFFLQDTGAEARFDSANESEETFPVQLLASPAEGQPFTVADTFTLHVVDAAGPPINSAPPDINTTPVPGSDTACTSGSWLRYPNGFTYRWMVGTRQVGTGATYRVASAEAGKMLRCEVTATNGSGSTIANSASERITVGADASTFGGVVFAQGASEPAAVVNAQKGTATLQTSCVTPLGASCTTTIALQTRAKSLGRAAASSPTLGSGKLTLAAGKSGLLKLKLTKAGKSRLGKKKSLKVTAKMTVVSGGVTLRGVRTLTLKRG
jgi:hypothetical protein